MIDNLFLTVVGFFNQFFERVGVDTYQLHHILRVKLLIDNRRPTAMFARRKAAIAATKAPTTVGTSWGVLIFSMIMGALYGIFLFAFHDNPLMGQTLYFFVFMMLMCLTLITDFTNVLMDVRDQYIILPRPVSDRTASMARILHITIYVMRLALLQGIPGMIMIGFIDGIAAVPVFFFQLMEATLLSIFTVNIVYLTLMRSVSAQRVKDIVSYFQIAFSIIIFAVARVPRMFSFLNLGHFSIIEHPWLFLLPPVWISSLNEVLIHAHRANYIEALLAFAGIAIPVASIWVVANVLAPGFNRIMAIMAASDGVSSSVKPKEIKRAGFIDKVANFLAPDPVENAGFRITWKLAARTREFKMKVYPSFAYVPVYFVYIMLSGRSDGGLAGNYAGLQAGKSYIFLFYMCVFVLSFILQNVSQSNKFKASWVYYAMPISAPGKILGGMYKAIIALYFVPYYLVLSIVALVVWGPAVINDILLAFFVNQVLGIMLALFMVKGFPFSKPLLNRRGSGRGFMSLAVLFIAGIVGFGHYVLARWETVIWICVVLAALLNWVMYNYYRKQSWDNIELADLEG